MDSNQWQKIFRENTLSEDSNRKQQDTVIKSVIQSIEKIKVNGEKPKLSVANRQSYGKGFVSIRIMFSDAKSDDDQELRWTSSWSEKGERGFKGFTGFIRDTNPPWDSEDFKSKTLDGLPKEIVKAYKQFWKEKAKNKKLGI